MEILINHKNADIILDTEKTLADVLSGIDQWISPAGNRIQGLTMDGINITDNLGDFFDKNVNDIKKLDILVCPWSSLVEEALTALLETCYAHEKAAYGEREDIVSAWGKSAAAVFLSQDIPDIGMLAGCAFAGEGISTRELFLLAEERLREVVEPEREISASLTLVEEAAGRMEDLPLDIQTGRDKRAAETIQRFSGIAEKLFRIYFVMSHGRLSPDTFIINKLPAHSFIDEFSAALKELSMAYENRDIVLAGDIAEYELAPRLKNFYNALRAFTESPSPLITAS